MNMRVPMVLVLLVAGCAVLDNTTQGHGVLDAGQLSFDDVFAAAMQAAHDAGFVVGDVSVDAGHLYATRSPNPLLTDATEIRLSVQVRERPDGFVVDIVSSLPGQLTTWGETRRAVDDYGRALRRLLPDLVLTIDGA